MCYSAGTGQTYDPATCAPSGFDPNTLVCPGDDFCTMDAAQDVAPLVATATPQTTPALAPGPLNTAIEPEPAPIIPPSEDAARAAAEGVLPTGDGSYVPGADEAAAPLTGDTYSDDGSGDPYYARRSSSTGYNRGGYSSGGYSGGGYNAGGGSSSSGGSAPSQPFPFADGFGNPTGDPKPIHADGWLPPMFGGSMSRTEFNQARFPDDGSSGPAQLPRLPYNPMPSVAGGGYSSGGSSGSGGGGADFARQMAYKLKGNMMGSGSSGYSSYDSGPTQSAYNQADKRYARDQKTLQEEYEKRSLFYANLSNPASMLPSARPGLTASSGGWGQMNALPMGQLALLAKGSKNDKFASNPKAFQKTLGGMYTDFSTKPGVFDYTTLMQNLFNAGKKSAVTRSFQTQAAGEAVTNKQGLYRKTKEGEWNNAPVGTQVSNMLSTLGAVYDVTRPDTASANMALAQQWANAWANKFQNKKKAPLITKYFGKKLGF